MTRYRTTVVYEGTGFYGWQQQPRPDGPPLRTVQGVLKDAMVETFQQRIRVVGASRTDSGVHANGQVAHFDAETRIPWDRMAMALNSRLPDDIEIREVVPVDRRFDAIRSARGKRYRYRIWTGRARPVFLRRVVYAHHRPLDTEAMAAAAARFVGPHDFAGFATAKDMRASTVRTIFGCRVERDPSGGPEVHIVVEGDGFLHNMVRIMAGTLLEVGEGKRPPRAIDALLAGPNRRRAGRTLPANGLCLERVWYPEAPRPVAGTPAERPEAVTEPTAP